MSKITSNDVEQEIVKLISGVIGASSDKIGPQTDFWKDLGVDSIKAIEIAVAIERYFKISIRDDQVAQISNVEQTVEVVRYALEKKNAK